jgi:hypothetical protein
MFNITNADFIPSPDFVVSNNYSAALNSSTVAEESHTVNSENMFVAAKEEHELEY